jgi:hypothetical protein
MLKLFPCFWHVSLSFVYKVTLHFESFTHTQFYSAVYEKMKAFFI